MTDFSKPVQTNVVKKYVPLYPTNGFSTLEKAKTSAVDFLCLGIAEVTIYDGEATSIKLVNENENC